MAWFPHYYGPRKRAATIHSVYIADGLADDCDELINRCCQAGTLNFNVFSNIWKDMNFAAIFQGRTSVAEQAELSEEALQVAKRYLVQDTTNFEESVASLFLIYSLLHLQPIEGFAVLRVVPADLEAIFRIEDTARQQNRHDVLYILASVLVKGPCQFHVGEREYGMDTGVRKYFDSITSIDKYGSRPKGVFYRQNEELDLLRELSSLGRRYARAKIFDESGVPDKTLRYTDEHLPNELAASLKQLIDGEKGSKSHATTVQSIKERAMWDAIKEMRHLKQLPKGKVSKKSKRRGNLNNNPTLSPTKSKSTSPSKNSKANSGIRNKPTNSPKKANTKYKSKSVVSSSSSDDDSVVLSSSNDESDNLTADEEDAEVNLNNLKTIDEYIDRMKSCPQTVTSDTAQATTSNSSLQYEIEVIDYMKDSNDVETTDTVIKETNKNPNKKQKIFATKTKPFNKSDNISKNTDGNENKDTNEDKSLEVEINLINEPICKPVRNTIIRKATNQKYSLERGPKGGIKGHKYEATSLKDSEALPQTDKAQSLPELVVLEIIEDGIEEDNGAGTEAVITAVEKVNTKDKPATRASKRKK